MIKVPSECLTACGWHAKIMRIVSFGIGWRAIGFVIVPESNVNIMGRWHMDGSNEVNQTFDIIDEIDA